MMGDDDGDDGYDDDDDDDFSCACNAVRRIAFRAARKTSGKRLALRSGGKTSACDTSEQR